MYGRIWLAVFASLWLCCTGCGGGNESPPAQTDSGGQQSASPQTGAGADPAAAAPMDASNSPEAVFAAMKQALQQDDWQAAAGFMTEDSQAMLAGSLVFMGGLAAAFGAENAGDIEALLQKHGITEQSMSEPPEGIDPTEPLGMMKALTAGIKDKPAFIGEMIAWMDQQGDGSEVPDFSKAELSDLSIDGETATATVANIEEAQPIEFRRVNGTWLVHLPDEHFEMAGGAGGEMDFGPVAGIR